MKTMGWVLLVALVGGGCAADPEGGASSSGGASSGGAHVDGVANEGETDVDCGGKGPAPRCADGKKCVDSGDCESGYCALGSGVCAKPTTTDGVKNGDETGTDCGGPEANPRCPTGETCVSGSDCESKVCDGDTKTCDAPSNDDGQQNGDESDVDCGGTVTAAPRCEVGKACNSHADCASDACSYEKKCVAGKSCTQHHGGDTCGPTGSPESCCTTLDVPRPGAPFKLDKYVITAGRFRQFVERTNGDIRGWIQDHRPAWWEPAWDDFVPRVLDDGSYISHEGVYQELGPGLFFEPKGGNQGCESEAYGARTYWIPDERSRELWSEVQHYPQDVLDEKALTCATFFMYAAFCAWDGGRMPTNAELDYAYTGGAANPQSTHRYPWGQNPVPAGWKYSHTNLAEALSGGTVSPAGGDQTRSAFSFNWWSPENRFCGTKAGGGEFCDFAVHVAPPGRFPAGNGPFGHSDLAGLVLHMTADLTGAPGSNPNGRNVVWGRNGSWEGHGIPFYSFTDTTPPSYRSTSKYRSAGARCAR